MGAKDPCGPRPTVPPALHTHTALALRAHLACSCCGTQDGAAAAATHTAGSTSAASRGIT